MDSTGQTFREQNREMLRQSGKMRSMLWILLVVIVALIMVVMFFLSDKPVNPIPGSSRQMVAVITPSWTASKGTMQRHERGGTEGNWVSVGSQAPIILGRNGLGWGRGLHQIPDDGNPVKQEGDGKSPAGVFRLEEAFGFPTIEEMGELKIPYRPVTEYLECIDDTKSQYYTQLLEKDNVELVDWDSSERIHRSPNAYHYGIMVEHNTADIQKGAGSCIILHCVSVTGDSTAGCTTMSRAEMENLVNWLDTGADPLLVQLPLPVYRRLQQDWKLPNI
ncbi:MAG: L,D-transpeptidase family protein [Candidatus Marinimicrobia bacterium]|nr:L,D-transpeptidase family protein [Candidatus Neomarinimicrobiota bacterium]